MNSYYVESAQPDATSQICHNTKHLILKCLGKSVNIQELKLSQWTNLMQLMTEWKLRLAISIAIIKESRNNLVKYSFLPNCRERSNSKFWEKKPSTSSFNYYKRMTLPHLLPPLLNLAEACNFIKRSSGTGAFLWILWNFKQNFFRRKPPVAASKRRKSTEI